MSDISLLFGRVWRKANRVVSMAYIGKASPDKGPRMVRLGSDYGGWYAPEDLAKDSVVYAVGVGTDATFDFAVAERGAETHSFDPTPVAVDYMEAENQGRVGFHQWALTDHDGTMRLYKPYDESHSSHFYTDLHGTGEYVEVPCLRLRTMMERLGHDQIDLLKIDIEGSWYFAIKEFIADGIRPKILAVEFDSPAPIWRVLPTVRSLRKCGYEICVVEKDNVTFILNEAA